jgi:hypothetical protein
MALLIQIRLPACESNCDADATHELRSSRNELKGRYCEKHAKVRLRALHLEENAGASIAVAQRPNAVAPAVEVADIPAVITIPEPRRVGTR